MDVIKDILRGYFIGRNEILILYCGVGFGKSFLATLTGLNAIQEEGI
ncbi:hypothetical protein JSQ81_05665 [Sporosarcina sp. Marseille-Q4063]|nr:hypothetical protein [Sporosarcina sp. Marseille-Q4063]QUW23057.1 hypothetical protein JSQ81_05665 [Sporosarcina sp. Marseille-Q4063]